MGAFGAECSNENFQEFDHAPGQLNLRGLSFSLGSFLWLCLYPPCRGRKPAQALESMSPPCTGFKPRGGWRECQPFSGARMGASNWVLGGCFSKLATVWVFSVSALQAGLPSTPPRPSAPHFPHLLQGRCLWSGPPSPPCPT